MGALGNTSWDPDDWERYALSLLRQRHGAALIPVPDKSGGDGGLDAYTLDGIAYQCYAPEGEPLTTKARYAAQRGKVTSDLKKLSDHPDRLRELLGSTVLVQWILVTPKHESANLVAHCATKSEQVLAHKLDFIAPQFRVSVQDLNDLELEHRILQAHRILPGGLQKASDLPDLDVSGVPFADATSPNIETMDKKLATVIPAKQRRDIYRAELLRAQIAGDDQLARFEDHLPDVAAELRQAIASAKRKVVMEQALEPFNRTHLGSVQDDVATRVTGIVPQLDIEAADYLAQSAVAQWLQECSMKFTDGEPEVGAAQ